LTHPPERDVTPAMSDRPDARSPRYLTVPECARALRVSEWWIRERISDGSLRALAVTGAGRRRRILRIRPEDWAAFRARFTGNATDPHFE
jgi:excisionase family DNA binding protein